MFQNPKCLWTAPIKSKFSVLSTFSFVYFSASKYNIYSLPFDIKKLLFGLIFKSVKVFPNCLCERTLIEFFRKFKSARCPGSNLPVVNNRVEFVTNRKKLSIEFSRHYIKLVRLVIEFFYKSLFSWQDPASFDREEQNKKVARTRDWTHNLQIIGPTLYWLS